MALSYVGGTSGLGTGSSYGIDLTSLTGGIASSPAAGDIVIVVTGWGSTSNDTPGVSSVGWTEIGNYYQSDARDANLSIAYKIMGGTPDTSVTVFGSGNANYGGATAVHVWRGVDPSTPLDVLTTAAGGNNNARPDSPPITPLAIGAIVLSAGLGTGDTTPQAFTAPTGFTNTVSKTGDGSSIGAIACVASYNWVSGAYNPSAWTGGESTINDSWRAASIVLRPYIHSPSPSASPSISPSASPSISPSISPSVSPSISPSVSPSASASPSISPSSSPSRSPSPSPSASPSASPSSSPSAGLGIVAEYGFEDWTGDAETTPAYLFSTNDSGEWAHHEASTTAIYDSGRAYAGNYYFHRQFNTSLSDSLLGGIASSIDDYGYIGLGGTYPIGSGDKFTLADEINTNVISIRFWFATTDDWKTQSSMDLCAFLRLLGNGGSSDAATAYVFLENGNNSDTVFYLFDPSSPTYYDQYNAGVDLQDGNWHSFGARIVRNKDDNSADNVTIRVWWDSWDMEGTPAAEKTITCSSFGDKFGSFQIAQDWSGSAPSTLMGLDLDAIEIWDGPLSQISSASPSASPSLSPSASISPSASPSVSPSISPSNSPSISPSGSSSISPSASPSASPSVSPSVSPSASPSPSDSPSISPSASPSISPSASPSISPSASPSISPSASPSASPSESPSASPSESPSVSPSNSPSLSPSASLSPSSSPSDSPSISPSNSPSVSPSNSPSNSPSMSPSESPSTSPSASPSEPPTTEFIQDVIARRGIKRIGEQTIRIVEFVGGEVIEPTAFEPDASTHRNNFYYSTITNALYRKIITRNEPGIIVAHWQKVSN